MFHAVNNEDTGHVWRYRAKSSTGVPNAVNLLFALKIGVMEPVLHDPLADCLHAVPVILPTTCRVWLKWALQDLDEEGYIKLTGKIFSLEQEATLAAAENKLRNKRSAEKSLNCAF